MGESASVLGPRLGKLHAWRDRGSNLTEGIRTSAQFGMLGAGVAKGAGFTDSTAALTIGIALAVSIEALKFVLGWLEYRYKVIHTQQGMVAEANPMTMRQVNALEALVSLSGAKRDLAMGVVKEMR